MKCLIYTEVIIFGLIFKIHIFLTKASSHINKKNKKDNVQKYSTSNEYKLSYNWYFHLSGLQLIAHLNQIN